MQTQEIPFHDGTFFRFFTDRGNVWVIVKPDGGGSAELYVAEESAALSAKGKSDAAYMRSREHAAARNRFGVSTIRGMLRYVQSKYPGVRRWVLDHKTRATQRLKVVEV